MDDGIDRCAERHHPVCADSGVSRRRYLMISKGPAGANNLCLPSVMVEGLFRPACFAISCDRYRFKHDPLGTHNTAIDSRNNPSASESLSRTISPWFRGTLCSWTKVGTCTLHSLMLKSVDT